MRSQVGQRSIHVGFNFLVMPLLKNLRAQFAVQCVVHNRFVEVEPSVSLWYWHLYFLNFDELIPPPCLLHLSYGLHVQTVCLDACKKLHEMGVFTDMLLPDKGSSEDGEKIEVNDLGEPLPGTARHREFYPEGIASILRVSIS